MYFYGRKVKETIMTAALRNGDVLAVVTYTDGRCGLARNGEPMHVFSWRHEELDECVVSFLQMISAEGLSPTSNEMRPTQQPTVTAQSATIP
jgi:hypothetical protein